MVNLLLQFAMIWSYMFVIFKNIYNFFFCAQLKIMQRYTGSSNPCGLFSASAEVNKSINQTWDFFFKTDSDFFFMCVFSVFGMYSIIYNVLGKNLQVFEISQFVSVVEISKFHGDSPLYREVHKSTVINCILIT